MRFLDVFTFIHPFIGFCSIALVVWHSLPKYKVPPVSEALKEVQKLLEHDEVIYIRDLGGYWANLANYRYQFEQMRVECNHSPGFFQQLCLLGLSWRLNSLKRRIEAFKREIELAMDERRLALLANA